MTHFWNRGGAAPDSRHWARVRALARPYRGKVVSLSGVSFIGGAIEAAFLVVVTRTALAIADGKASLGVLAGWTLPVGGAVAFAAALLVVRLGLQLLGVSFSASLMLEVSTAMRRKLAGAYLHTSWATQQAEPSGQLQQLVLGFAGAAVGVMSSFTSTVTALLNLAALIAVAVLVSPLATLVVIGALVVLGTVLAPIRRRIRLRSRAAAVVQMEFATAVSELGSLGLEMQAYGVRDRFVDRLGVLIGREATARRNADVLAGALAPVYTSLAYGALVAGLGIAALVGVSGITALGAVMLVMLRSLSYGQQLQVASGSLMSSIPFLDQIDSTIERYEVERATGGEIRLDRVGEIEAEYVSFEYVPGRRVLHELSFSIARGEVVGVIGPSGAGKSTLVQLLLGLRDPTEGVVKVDGVDLRDVHRPSWSGLVAFVSQDALLVTGTVADNIRFFRDGLDDEALRLAAEQANILADIEAMPDGFDTHLGERGTQLSGGQRQRLSIARALAGRPGMLILDEPTSALDVNSEALIRTTVSELKGAVTVVVIAHRMSTLDMCDRIMVIEAGHLMAFDDPEALRGHSDFYRIALELSGMA